MPSTSPCALTSPGPLPHHTPEAPTVFCPPNGFRTESLGREEEEELHISFVISFSLWKMTIAKSE